MPVAASSPTRTGSTVEGNARLKSQVNVERALSKGIIFGSVLTAIVLCFLFLVLTRKNDPTSKATPVVAKEHSPALPNASPPIAVPAATTAPVVNAPAIVGVPPTVNGAQSTIPTPPAEGPRERYARERWAALKAQAERTSEISDSLKIAIKSFAESYENLPAGKEAAEFYRKIPAITTSSPPPPPPPPPPPAGGKVIADFKRDFKLYTPGLGWRYLWNPNGAIGESSKYVQLVWNNEAGYAVDPKKFPADPPAGCVSINGGGGHPGKGVRSGSTADRFAIAAYTLQPGQSGKSALSLKMKRTDSQHPGRVELRILVNDTEKKKLYADKGNLEFSTDLGPLKETDTVYVAIGPDGEDDCDTYTLEFTLYPTSQP